MRTLFLPLKAKWYNMIESGFKKEEYREYKPFWIKRLMGFMEYCGVKEYYFKDYTHVCFSYGYTKRTMTFEIESKSIGFGKQEWGAPSDKEVFIIKLGIRVK